MRKPTIWDSDQIRHKPADLCLCFHLCMLLVFLCGGLYHLSWNQKAKLENVVVRIVLCHGVELVLFAPYVRFHIFS